VRLAVVLVSGVGFGCGIAGIVWAWHLEKPEGAVPPRIASSVARWRGQVWLLALATAAGVLAAVATGWPVAVPIVGVAVFGLPKLFGQTAGSISIVKIESIATWTEMLQGTLAASAGLTQAIVATAPLSPLPIREAAMLLSGRLSAGMHPGEALLLFADDVGDACADRVVCALQLAVSSRAQRMGDLLSALADSTRDEVALRLRIETSRASIRSGVRTVLVVSVVFAAALAVLSHPYLQPFDSANGQVVLLVVGAMYGLGLTLMVSMARPPAPVRLLGQQVATQ